MLLEINGSEICCGGVTITFKAYTTAIKIDIMKNRMIHFAIHFDDIDRAKSFYDGVFDWGFYSYGHDDFLQIRVDKTDSAELIGALQSRAFSLVPEKLIGLECTIEVADVDEIIERVKSNGGQILMPKTAIPSVGWITKFLDTEGNLICAMHYDQKVRR